MGLENDKRSWLQPALQVFGEVTIWVAVPVVASLFAGKWLDTYFGTKPFIFLGLTAVAFLISLFGIMKTVNKYLKKISQETDVRNNQPK